MARSRCGSCWWVQVSPFFSVTLSLLFVSSFFFPLFISLSFQAGMEWGVIVVMIVFVPIEIQELVGVKLVDCCCGCSSCFSWVLRFALCSTVPFGRTECNDHRGKGNGECFYQLRATIQLRVISGFSLGRRLAVSPYNIFIEYQGV